MIPDLLLLLFGLAVLTAGADVLVRGGSSLAQHLGLPPLVIGLTVVAFGTSTPEMIVTIGGALKGQGDLAIGNVVGSNIFNVGFILGVCALISPMKIELGIIKRDAPICLLVALLAGGMVITGSISRWAGFLLLGSLMAYTIWTVRMLKRTPPDMIPAGLELAIPPALPSFGKDILLVLGGLGLLMAGAHFLVNSSTSLARAMGISEAVIGLTIVAAGTSMPECATSVVAALRGKPELAVGNIIGSNIFNVLGILGLTALIKPISAPNILPIDLWAMIGFSLVLWPLLLTKRKLERWEGFVVLCLYATYIWARWP